MVQDVINRVTLQEALRDKTLYNVHSIFESISGEYGCSIPQGRWCSFVRLQGCNLKCSWCDTLETQDKDKDCRKMTLAEISREVHCKDILITGGEPLYHPNIYKLIYGLSFLRNVQVETNGSIRPQGNGSPAGWVVDYKCPSSEMDAVMPTPKNFIKWWNTIVHIVKFVVKSGSEEDALFTFNRIQELLAQGYHGEFIVSPTDDHANAIALLHRVLKPYLPRIIFSVQLHKLLKMP